MSLGRAAFAFRVLTWCRIIGFWYTNAYNTGYLPINANRVFDNKGKSFQVRKILNEHGNLDFAKYNQYSEPWMAAGNLIVYFWFFASYTASECLPHAETDHVLLAKPCSPH